MPVKRTLAAALAACLFLLASCGPAAPGTVPELTTENLTEDIPMTETKTAVPDGFDHYGDLVVFPSGYEKFDEGFYVFRDGFALDVKSETGDFNRWSLTYTSTAPLKGTIEYVQSKASGTVTATETFYLEAGTEMTFSSLINDSFKSAKATGIVKFTLSSANRTRARFAILGFEAEQAEVVKGGTYYLENDRYRVGVLLSWGGGISYIEDKQDCDDSLGNLINHCDTGRLIQQSYYGVGNGSYYTSAQYNGTTWNYNPVQGGDQYGNASKIVDFRLSEDGKALYIKAQPMDWAQKNSPCPAYMENTYTLLDDGIRVENRFVDFMGAPHPACHQELPAFYVISALGVFHYYGGTKPWTGDAYRTLPDEPFWAGQNSCYHSISKSNTETWAAWTNTEGYGIGLFVPGTEIMLAGRFSYNGSKDPANGATNYVAPLRTMALQSFTPFTYAYVISTGTVDEMRATFEKYK